MSQEINLSTHFKAAAVKNGFNGLASLRHDLHIRKNFFVISFGGKFLDIYLHIWLFW